MNKRTLRVYGFLEDATGRLLIAFERFRGMPLVKFPGGGIEWGESHQTALCREFQEELGLHIAVGPCLFFNDFAVQSAIDPEVQVQSFFYAVRALEPLDSLVTSEVREVPENEGERFVWVPAEEVLKLPFTFEIEQAASRAWAASKTPQ
jgi:8-oxo-dGTP diphosphatase